MNLYETRLVLGAGHLFGFVGANKSSGECNWSRVAVQDRYQGFIHPYPGTYRSQLVWAVP